MGVALGACKVIEYPPQYRVIPFRSTHILTNHMVTPLTLLHLCPTARTLSRVRFEPFLIGLVLLKLCLQTIQVFLPIPPFIYLSFRRIGREGEVGLEEVRGRR